MTSESVTVRKPQSRTIERFRPVQGGPSTYPIVHLSSEYLGLARTGGLGEVVRRVAEMQVARGHPVTVFLPAYRSIHDNAPTLRPWREPYTVALGDRTETIRLLEVVEEGEGPRVLLVDHPDFFDRPGIYGEAGGDYRDNHLRFALFSRAVVAALPLVSDEPPLVNAHDWHTALAPVYARTLLAGDPYFDATAFVLTVHNAGYQGHFGPEVLAEVGLPASLFHWQRMEWYGKVNFLKGGLVFSDYVTTVSPTHAHELRTRFGGFGLHEVFMTLQDRFVGILNGIDQSQWNPATDPHIEANYTLDDFSGKARCKAWLQESTGLPARPELPLFGMTARLVYQKGLDLILGADLIHQVDAQFIFLGAGEPHYHEAFSALAERSPDRIAVRFEFSTPREHQLLAGADALLMPSLYEPCGLTQMRAQRYGTLPVVRRVGGLADTVEDQVTGFLFDAYDPVSLEDAVRRALGLYQDPEAWLRHALTAMQRDFSWDRSVDAYAEIYAAARSEVGTYLAAES